MSHKRVRDEDSAEDGALPTPPITLDTFMAEMHNSTTLEATDGMPALEWLKQTFKTKSGAIRYLQQQGYNAIQIAKHLGIKYQHARNVMTQELKRGPNETYNAITWQCPHTQAEAFVDVIIRHGIKDPNSSRILYRVCCQCSRDNIPGCTEEAFQKALPGVKMT